MLDELTKLRSARGAERGRDRAFTSDRPDQGRREPISRVASRNVSPFPSLLTPAEVAVLLRTSRKAVYAMIERAQLPGLVRIGRRVLIREADLLDWLRQKSTPSLESRER